MRDDWSLPRHGKPSSKGQACYSTTPRACRCQLQRCGVILESEGRTLGELEEVLLAVDDLEGADGGEFADVPRVEPAVLVQHLIRLLLVLLTEPAAHYSRCGTLIITLQCTDLPWLPDGKKTPLQDLSGTLRTCMRLLLILLSQTSSSSPLSFVILWASII